MQVPISTIGKQILANAYMVWKEAARDKSFFVLAVVGVLLELFSVFLGNMAVGGEDRILQNMGFWVMSIWGPITIMYLGSNLVNKELKDKTAYLILSRPISRSVYLFGKYIGLLMCLLSIFAVLVAVWLLLLFSFQVGFTMQHAIAILFLFGEWMLLAAVSLFFNVFTTPVLHNFFLLGIYVLGHLSNELYNYAQMTKSIFFQKILVAIYYVLPNLEIFNFKKAALYSQPIDTAAILYAVFILIGWIVAFNLASFLIFRFAKLK